MSIFGRKKATEQEDKYIKKVAKKYDASYEKVKEMMDYAQKKYGVSPELFASKNMFVLNERRWRSIAYRARLQREEELAQLKAAGISESTAANLIERIKEKTFYSFSIEQLIQYGLVFMDFEEACGLAEKLKRRRAVVNIIRKDLKNGVVSEKSSGIFANGVDAAASGAFSRNVEELFSLIPETMTKKRHDELAKKAKDEAGNVDENMVIDMDASYRIFGTSSMEYMLYRFKNIPFADRYAFLTNKLKNETLRALPKDEAGDRFREICDMVDNKIASYEKYKEYYKRECLAITSKLDYPKFVEFCKKHDRFIKKPLTSSQGKNIEVFDVSAAGADFKKLFERVRTEKSTILEELVVQNEVTAKFNPDSLNTFRIITVNDGESVKAKWGFFRTGRAGSVVDNAGAGGVFSVIDCKTGTLCTDGADEAGNSYPVHPETAEKYLGFEIPKWEELEDTCVKLSEGLPEAAIVGWDFAYNDKEEWVLIEANLMPEFVFQGPTGVGVREEFMQLIEKRRENIYG